MELKSHSSMIYIHSAVKLNNNSNHIIVMGRNTFGMGSMDYSIMKIGSLAPFGAWTNNLEGF
jgi:hypothetical protein